MLVGYLARLMVAGSCWIFEILCLASTGPKSFAGCIPAVVVAGSTREPRMGAIGPTYPRFTIARTAQDLLGIYGVVDEQSNTRNVYI